MKYLLTVGLLLTMTAYGQEAATMEEPAAAEIVENEGHKEWPTLDEWWKENKLNEGTLSAEVLLGYEYSNLSDNGTKAAQAMLTRTRLNYKTANYEGFDGFIQAQYVGPINDHYSYPGGGNANYDVVNDREAFRLHQAYLAYTGYDSHARIGPQEILLDNQRFIGNVGWRLNAQSFNAGLIQNNSVDDLTLFYSYADSINDISGDINHKRQYHLLNAEYALGTNNQVSAFGYLQRNDAVGQPEKVDTFGLRAWGKNGKVSHDAIVALQRDAYYGSLFGGLDIDAIDLGAGVEYISGGDQPGERFLTLNGTGHKFNGWADQFLGTGGGAGNVGLAGGLIDLYAQASGLVAERVTLVGKAHYFTTANETAGGFNGPYGYELDASAKYRVCRNFDLIAKMAYYIEDGNHADNLTADETVFWLRGILTF